MTDKTLEFGNIEFCTHDDHALFIGRSNADRPRWLEANKHKWQHIEDD